jgi:predicted TPR repeat methyltransferase
MSGTFEQARAFFLQGLAHYQAGRYADADTSLSAALALVPGRPSTLTNLGATRLKLGRPAEALELLQEALATEPGNIEALGHCASALAELGQAQSALDCLDRLLAVDDRVAHAWSLRGSLLREQGHHTRAAASFRQALDLGADPVLNGFYLAGLGQAEMPPAAPPDYVEQLFDGYAQQFDGHLVQQLNYHAPDVLVARLGAFDRRFEKALDLGCGTGLCGQLLQHQVSRIDGVDLSSNMLARARAHGVYTQLVQADAAAFLATTAEQYDLVLAADVFIYVGALEAVFAGMERVLRPQGVFCFSVEALDGELDADPPDVASGRGPQGVPGLDWMLRSSMRYAHRESYIRRLAAHHGFQLADTVRQPLREEQRRPVPGLFFWLTKP